MDAKLLYQNRTWTDGDPASFAQRHAIAIHGRFYRLMLWRAALRRVEPHELVHVVDARI